MTNVRIFFVAVAMSVLGTSVSAHAELKVEDIFSSQMVLQRDMPVPVWGRADAGETVTVHFAGQDASGVADAAGEWMVKLSPMPVSVESRVMDITGSKGGKVSLKDVLVGDVWLCSGQSNMSLPLYVVNGGEAEIAAANNPMMRLFGVAGFHSVLKPEKRIPQHSGWDLTDPKSTRWCSAVEYYFGRDLQRELKIPIGLIGVSLGGSMAEAWFPADAQKTDPSMKQYLAAWDWLDANFKELPRANHMAPRFFIDASGKTITGEEFGQRFQDWRHQWDRDKKEGKPIPPGYPADFRRNMPHVAPTPDSMDRPGVAYNSMLAPIIPFGIKGVVWYQGEANAGSRDPHEYRLVMETLIGQWRRLWGQGDFQFALVQLPNFASPIEEPVKGNWPILREQQVLITRTVPKTSLAVTIDTASPKEPDAWHPRNKEPVGHRMALAVLSDVYEQKVEASGPVYKSMQIEGAKIRLTFDHVAGGLEAHPPLDFKVQGSATPESKLKGFAIAGADQVWHWADAAIDASEVVVWNNDVTQPVAVRYAWSNFPPATLYNSVGLPAGPFRTDDWKLIAED